MRRFLRALVLTATIMFSLGFSGLALAAPAVSCSNGDNPLQCACDAGGGVANSAGCSADPTTDPISGPHGVVKKASLLLAILGAIAAIVVIIIGGFQFILSNGDAQKAASARNSVLGAVIGLAIIALAESIVLFVVSKL